MTENALYTLWLILAGKPGSARNYRLIRAMEAKEAFNATKKELLAFLEEKDAAYFLNKDLFPARNLLQTCRDKGINIVCYHDPDYPPPLREIEDPPPALFYYGSLPEPGKPTVGIVGTRKCTADGAAAAAGFSCSLALSGFQIVSGMASGIDTYAHKGSLIRGNRSFAVLGCGVDILYPKENKSLYDLLKTEGGLISEYLPGTPPLGKNFPRRNRIISGLSDGVLVVECPPKSGSMSTARFAVEQNRTLFAVPAAPNDRINTGTNQLIKHGAVFCTEPNDIYNEFRARYGDRIDPHTVRYQRIPVAEVEAVLKTGRNSGRTAEAPKNVSVPKPKAPERAAPPREKPKPAAPALSPEETTVYKAFDGAGALSADELCQRTGLPFHRMLPLLQALELTGCIEPLPGSMFRRK